MSSATLTSALFRRACSRFATGIGILTVRAEDHSPHGLTVNSFSSVSCNPPLISVCVASKCKVLPHLIAAKHFAVNVLTDKQRDLSIRFSERPDERFDGVSWHAGASGAPMLDHALARFDCRLERVIEAGDHVILLGEVEAAEASEGRPLVFYGSGYNVIGL